MPHATTRHTLSRQWELLKLLPGRGAGKTSKALAEALNEAGFRVSKRQVERDLGDLMESFPIDCNNASSPYGWRWVPGASADIPGLTLAEALSLHLIEETLRPLLPASVLQSVEPRLQQAAKKLASDERVPLARWKDKVRCIQPTLPLLAPEVPTEIIEGVHAGLLGEWQLGVLYRPMDAEDPRSLTLHPMGLVQRGPVSYLIATAFDYLDLRLYALHRFISVVVTDAAARRLADFDIDRYIHGGALQFTSTAQEFQLILGVHETMVRILRETPLSADQEIRIRADGFTVLSTVVDSWQLRWWILAQGDQVEVLEPLALRREIATICRKMSESYGQENED
jgi:predicted DNA-binding transcriptional regulator YafY